MRKALSLSLLFFVLIHVGSLGSWAQEKSSLSVFFSDSLEAEIGSYFVYGHISVNNRTAAPTSMQLSYTTPAGWVLLGEKTSRFTAYSDSTYRIPFTLLRQRHARANWLPLQLRIDDEAGHSLLDTFLLIKAPAISDFSVLASISEIEIGMNDDQLLLPLQLFNKGTTDGVYTISDRSGQLELKKSIFLHLEAGKDTNILLPIKLSAPLLKNDNRVVLQITDSTGISRSLPVTYNRVYRSLKMNPSRYKMIPFSVEAGSFLVDRVFYYYVDVTSSILLKKGLLDISYRTKTFGPLRTVERNILVANFRSKRLDLSFGHLSQIKHFYANGRGVRASYKGRQGVYFDMEAITPIKNSVQSNYNFSSSIEYASKKAQWKHQLVLDLDKKRGLNGYLLFHESKFQLLSNSFLSINLSAGWENYTRIKVFSNNDLGIGLGYAFLGQHKKWDWQSIWQYHQKSYPGVNKGARTVFQMLRWKIQKSFLEISYQYNSTTSSILQDTLYIADAFNFNMEKLGGKWAVGTEKINFSLGTGLFRQTGLSAGQLPRYQYGELTFSARLLSPTRLSFSSFTGYANNARVAQPVWLTNSTFDLQYKRIGIKGFYVQQPVLRDSILKYLVRYNQTLLLSPYLNFSAFKRLTGSFRYSISKSLYDNRTTTSVGFNLLFRTKKDDWQITTSGAIPITRSLAPGSTGFSFPYLTFAVKKRLNVPALFKRRYHDLTIVAYEDLNVNGIMDSADRKIPDCRISVDNKHFITDSSGMIVLSNADTGIYKITVQPRASNKSLIPLEKNKIVSLQRNEEVFLPFRVGHLVYGKVLLDLDRYSGLKFTPENILIRAINEQGKEFTVLTDSTGGFSLPLPAGRYTVALNAEAFTGTIKPEKLSFTIDLISFTVQEVNFKLVQRRREIRMRQL